MLSRCRQNFATVARTTKEVEQPCSRVLKILPHISHDHCSSQRVSPVLWPVYLPSLAPWDVYLWGSLKDEVCRMNTHMKEESKEKI